MLIKKLFIEGFKNEEIDLYIEKTDHLLNKKTINISNTIKDKNFWILFLEFVKLMLNRKTNLRCFCS